MSFVTMEDRSGSLFPGSMLIGGREDTVVFTDDGFFPGETGTRKFPKFPGKGGELHSQVFCRPMGSNVAEAVKSTSIGAHPALEFPKGYFVQTL